MPSPFTPRKPAAYELYLEALAVRGEQQRSAQLSGLSREAVRLRARRDPEFAEREAAARARYQEQSISAGRRRIASAARRPDLD